jgi:4-amino-4-deoxy-L-arabinose transferase-like glycosyltransferase
MMAFSKRAVPWLGLAQPTVQFYLVFVLALLMLFANLHRGDLAGYDDAVYAHEGKEMLRSGDWANVWLNGKLDFDKPPLFIWLEALSFWLVGVNDFAAKFPVALLGLGTIVLVYFITRAMTDDSWLPGQAMLVLASTQYFLKYAQHAMTDVPFAFLFALGIWAYLKARSQPAFYSLCGLTIGCAGLTRSILGILAVGVIGAHLLITRRWKALRGIHLWFGLIVAVGLPLGWLMLQAWWYGDAFVRHHFSYMAENASSIEPQRGWGWLLGLGIYPFLLVKLFWPWLPCLIGGVVLLMRNIIKGSDEKPYGITREMWWLLAVWAVVVMLPFSLIQHKVLRYILPVFPALAIVSAVAWRHWMPERWLVRSFAIACALMGASVLFLSLTASYRLRATEVRPLALLADRTMGSGEEILLYTGSEARWDYLHQIIWYTDRRAQMLFDVRQALCQLQQPTAPTLIVDLATYQEQFQSLSTDLEVIGQTSKLVCLRRKGSISEFSTDAKLLLKPITCN